MLKQIIQIEQQLTTVKTCLIVKDKLKDKGIELNSIFYYGKIRDTWSILFRSAKNPQFIKYTCEKGLTYKEEDIDILCNAYTEKELKVVLELLVMGQKEKKVKGRFN